MTKLSVIIVSYNTAQLTVQAVRSVLATGVGAADLEIIVVDNNSHDETLAELKKIKDKRLKLVESGENLGFGRGNNLGIVHSQGSYYLFLNSDTLVKPGALETLLKTYRQQEKQGVKLGLLAAGLRNPDGTYQVQGGDLPSLIAAASQWWFWDDLPLIGKYLPSIQKTGRNWRKSVHWQGWVGGTAVMVNRDLLERFGAWDEKIFMYGEDIDLSWRLFKAGYKNGLVPAAEIIHFGQASSSSKNAILGEVKGLLYVWEKYCGSRGLWCLKKIIAWGCILRILFYSIQAKREQQKIYGEALEVVRQ